MKGKLADILKFVVFLGIGLFFVYYFLLKLDADTKAAIWNSLTGANYWWVGVSVLVNFVALIFRGLRWKLLYKPLGLSPSLNNVIGSTFIAYFANLAFPRLGEVLRCATLKTSEDIPIDKSLGTVVTERMMDVLLFFVVVLIGVATMFSNMKEWFGSGLAEKFQSLPTLAAAAAIALVVVVLMVLVYRRFRSRLITHKAFKKIDNIFVGLADGIKTIFHLGRKDTTLFFVYSAVIYMCYILGGMFIFYAFDEMTHFGFTQAFVVYLFGSVGMTISQGGIGAYPTLVQTALATYGISFTTGTACGWLMWSSSQAMIVVFGLIYTVYFSLKKKKTNTIQK